MDDADVCGATANGRSEKMTSSMTTDGACKIQSVHWESAILANCTGTEWQRKTTARRMRSSSYKQASTYSRVVNDSVYPLGMGNYGEGKDSKEWIFQKWIWMWI
jgi:hypothetical protein